MFYNLGAWATRGSSQPGLETFFMLNSTEQDISIAHKTKMMKIKSFLAFRLSDISCMMLVNVKKPENNCWHFNIYEHD